MLIGGLTFAAGVYGAYHGHKHQERMNNALDEQTEVLKEQLNVFRNDKDCAEPGLGGSIDEMA